MGATTWSVGEVARLSGLTVRALHHYDAIGLLRPSGRTGGGHRVYDVTDLERLQRVRAYRQLGFGLGEVAALLDDPSVDPVDHLRRRREVLVARADEISRMVEAIDRTMEARAMGVRLTPEEMFEVFGDEDPNQHAAEAAQRWGGTDPYVESQRRTAGYTKEDWQRMRKEMEQIEAGLASALRAGLDPGSTEVMDVAEAHRRHISRWFYDCSTDMHRGLAEMYVADERFAAHYDGRAGGLAQYVREAVLANADRGQDRR